jgi:hypothetical protein
MSDQASLHAAIGMHTQWKGKLRQAIYRGVTRVTMEELREEDCALGALLQDPQCRILHQHFHAAAQEVLELACAGNRKEALERIEPGTRFSMALSALSRAVARAGA